ncbi:MAG: hypothetical protein JXB04_08990 [Kiritimatiellae bacterium]|nr:hypothetical protein [Kiritimatiellia bacterium]
MMKTASMIVGAIGILVTLAAIIGRYRAACTVTFMGRASEASSVLLAAIPILLIAILLAVLGVCEKK